MTAWDLFCPSKSLALQVPLALPLITQIASRNLHHLFYCYYIRPELTCIERSFASKLYIVCGLLKPRTGTSRKRSISRVSRSEPGQARVVGCQDTNSYVFLNTISFFVMKGLPTVLPACSHSPRKALGHSRLCHSSQQGMAWALRLNTRVS